jgi:membrane fusion protein (multidrug efflux system)
MKYGIAVLVLLVFAGGGYYAWTEMQKTESTDDAEIDGSIYSISSRIPGHVVEVKVADEQFVNEGDVLVRLDPKDHEVAIAKAKADLGDAMAGLESSRTDVPLTNATTASTLNSAKSMRQDAAVGVTWAQNQLGTLQARLAVSQANVKVAEANANKAAQDVQRYKALVAKDEISKQLYDQSVAAADAAKATVDAQRAAVNEVQQQLVAAQTAVEQARAKLSQADAKVEAAMTGPQQVSITQSKVKAGSAKVEQFRAQLEQAQLNLQYTTIVAPISGVVGKKTVNAGQNVGAGQEMMAIVPLDGLYVTANFKETQLRRMKPGQSVKLDVDAYGKVYTGRVERVAGASGAKFSLLPPENATGNYVKVVQRIPVRISIDPGQDKEHLLRPGMSVVPVVSLQ